VLDRFSWRRADLALTWLVLLATLAAWLALTLSATGLESALALFVTICRRTLDETLAHSGELGRLSLLLPLGLGLFLALTEALRLTRATRRWMMTLTPVHCAPNKRLRRLSRKCGLLPYIALVRIDRPLVFTHGLVNPQIWLSTGLVDALSDNELEAVLRHEAHHRTARDPLKILVARCLGRGLFFIPVARDLCEAYCLAKEIAADEHATRIMGDALPLARALRKLIAHPIPLMGAALVSEGNTVETRLLALLNPSQPIPFFATKHLGLSLLWLLILLTIVFAPAAGHVPSLSECAPTALLSIGRL
jgi:Zn-dependent protease with chaperone function